MTGGACPSHQHTTCLVQRLAGTGCVLLGPSVALPSASPSLPLDACPAPPSRVFPPQADELKTLVDLGGGVHCQARVPDPSRVFLACGLGFYAECAVGSESSRVLALRRSALQARQQACIDQAAGIRTSLAFVSQALGQLMSLAEQPTRR